MDERKYTFGTRGLEQLADLRKSFESEGFTTSVTVEEFKGFELHTLAVVPPARLTTRKELENMSMNPDFVVQDHGSIWLLNPVSDAAKAWVEANIPEDAQTLGNAVAVEHRFISDIVDGIKADGLTVIVR